MALSVIGAGFGRTGTESLKTALERLGYDPCYHMFEVLPHPDRIDLWRAAARGELPDWDEVFADYRATVDWPAAFFWRELADHYPEAKIILSLRDPDKWYESMDKTILSLLRKSTDPDSIGYRLIVKGVFGGNIRDRDHVIQVYKDNNAAVQAAFSADRLLTYQPGDGWGPLCRFLGCPEPDEPYPHKNQTENFQERLEGYSVP